MTQDSKNDGIFGFIFFFQYYLPSLRAHIRADRISQLSDQSYFPCSRTRRYATAENYLTRGWWAINLYSWGEHTHIHTRPRIWSRFYYGQQPDKKKNHVWARSAPRRPCSPGRKWITSAPVSNYISLARNPFRDFMQAGLCKQHNAA